MMKKLKLTKTSWLLLGAGIFIVVAASLGLSHSRQIKEQSQLEEELSVAQMRLDKLQVKELRVQQEELQSQLDESTVQLLAARSSLRRPIESANLTDEFFAIAQSCNVIVDSISSSGIKEEKLDNISCSAISLDAAVTGEVPDLINMVVQLNDYFITGVVKSAQISIPEAGYEKQPSARIAMVIRTYEGG
jgi:hypothetical protein